MHGEVGVVAVERPPREAEATARLAVRERFFHLARDSRTRERELGQQLQHDGMRAARLRELPRFVGDLRVRAGRTTGPPEQPSRLRVARLVHAPKSIRRGARSTLSLRHQQEEPQVAEGQPEAVALQRADSGSGHVVVLPPDPFRRGGPDLE